jgi:hypothetical protein
MTKEPKRRGAAPAIGLILLAALSLITWLGTGFEAEDVQANHGVAMAIDVDSSGNTRWHSVRPRPAGRSTSAKWSTSISS